MFAGEEQRRSLVLVVVRPRPRPRRRRCRRSPATRFNGRVSSARRRRRGRQ